MKLIRKRWFWVVIISLFVLVILFEIALAALILITSLSSGLWSTTLLGLGLLYTGAVLYRNFLPRTDRKQMKWGGRLVLLVIAIIAFPEHGFFKTLYFLATVFIFTTLTNWIVSMLVKKKWHTFYRYISVMLSSFQNPTKRL